MCVFIYLNVRRVKVLQLQHKLVETKHYVSHQSRASWPQKPSQIFMKEEIFFLLLFLWQNPKFGLFQENNL